MTEQTENLIHRLQERIKALEKENEQLKKPAVSPEDLPYVPIQPKSGLKRVVPKVYIEESNPLLGHISRLEAVLRKTLPSCHGADYVRGMSGKSTSVNNIVWCKRVANWHEHAVADASSWYCDKHKPEVDPEDIPYLEEDLAISEALALLEEEV